MGNAADRALAIVGVSAILPDAPDVATFWRNVKESRYSIGEIPPGRWDPAHYYDADPSVPEKTYSKIGGWVRDWEWDPMGWRLPIPPKVADAMDESQKWAVACARGVLLDYGHPERPLDLRRTAVVVGSAMSGDRHYWTALPVFFPEFAAALAEAPSFAALPADVQETITREYHERIADRLPAISEDSMPGELANCIAGRIANVFDFHGPNFVCDAACASALAAIDAAHDGLLEGEYDAALVGGVDRNMGPAPFVKFSKIGALSATGTRPYADGADGFVMGEGAAFFLLKRLEDAEAQGDRIYAVLRGVAGSSDGRGKGITAPNPAGQRIAVDRAWRDAGLSPGDVTLVEGHGTSTRVGDVVEVETLNSVFGGYGLAPGSIALGSVKSNIGHLKGAAGAAGLLKVVLSLHDKVLPPSLNCERPNPNIDFASSPFYVNTELKPWDVPEGGVRRAGLSAFGFGGTNYHAVLEEYIPGRIARERSASSEAEAVGHALAGAGVDLAAPPRGALVLGEASPEALRARLEEVLAEAKAGRAPAPAAPEESRLRAAERLAIDYGDAAELATKAERALKAFAAGDEGGESTIWKVLRSQGIFRGRGEAPKVAFLYTGQGSQYVNMLRGLRESEPDVSEVFDAADRVMTPLLGRPLSEIIFVDSGDSEAVDLASQELRRTEITQPAVLTVDAALTRMLGRYGVVPDMVMGHSLGEYGALVAAGALPFDHALEAVSARGRGMANLAIEDNGLMAAVFAPLDEIESVLAGIEGNVVVANVNSTSQAVIGGASAAVEEAMAVFQRMERNVVPLPVSHAFHTSIVAPASEPLREALEQLSLAPPSTPLVANVTGELYPMGPDAVPQMLDLLAKQVASPVQFVKGLRTLFDAGVRVFVEVGPKKALHGFANEVLGDEPGVLALFTNHPKLGDDVSLNHALCGLYASGLGVGRGEDTLNASGGRESAAIRPNIAAQASVVAGGAPHVALTEERYADLGRLFAEFMERGADILGSGGGKAPTRSVAAPVVTGASLGLPGRERIFDDLNVQSILDGEQEIDLIPTRFRHAMVDKHITRLVKSGGGGPHFESIDNSSDVIKLAARGGRLDLEEEFGVSADRLPALDWATQLAMAAGLEAMRDAGIPLVMRYRTTSKGTKLPDRWMLPDSLRDETGVIFASAFPGYDSFAEELGEYFEDHSRVVQLDTLHSLRKRAGSAGGGSEVLANEIERRIHELEQEQSEKAFAFDRRFLFRILSMGHSQFAEYIGARGPNTHLNSACASTTQAFSLAEDWIAAGRCRRVVIVAADDPTSDHMLEWIGAGFLASGAAAIDDVVEDAALPFDRRRHGMILGMGAAGVVVESPECARERGLRPICEVLSTVTANSAFHGTRLDVEHIGDVMERLISQAEQRFGVDRYEVARELMFMSHETYTPARGGSASAEVEALRRVFGDSANAIVVANTKGFTGHPMGVGIEDVVAIKALETGTVPPVPNYKERDPDLGPLNLSQGGIYPIRYALRLGAGFGSQISMSLLRWSATPDGSRPAADSLGYETRMADPAVWQSWLQRMSGETSPEIEVARRTLRVKDALTASWAEQAAKSAAAPATVATQAAPSAGTGAAAAVAPLPAATERAAGSVGEDTQAAFGVGEDTQAADGGSAEDAVREQVLAIVAEKTGYPSDMLDLDLDLEADLGVDTVKQAETFAAIREHWDIPRDENLKLRDYPTLGHTIRFVMERAEGFEAPAAIGTPASAPTPSAAAPASGGSAVAAGNAEDAVREQVLAIVAEKTGYPSDMLDLDLDLEADLGVDTVKQAETFAAIREHWDIPRDENLQLRDYPTLGHTIRFVMERAEGFEAPAAIGTPASAPAPSAPAPASGGSAVAAGNAEDAVREQVLAIVAEKTGYPSDMLDLDLDLEADLGVDTVKQAETFAAIREHWDIPRDENLQLRDYPTLGHTIRFVMERAQGLEASTVPAAPAASEAPVSAPAGPPLHLMEGSLEAADTIPRRGTHAVLRPPLELCSETGVSLGEGARVIVMPDQGGVAKALVGRLEKRGVEVLLVDREAVNERAEIAKCIEGWLASGPVHGLYWLPALDAEATPAQLDLAQWRAGLLLRVKLFQAAARTLFDQLAEPGRFVVSATRLGGRHGLDAEGARAPMGGAVTGFTKALGRERPEALVKAVDFPVTRKTAELADTLVDETLRDPGAVEIGVQEGRRFTVALAEEPAADGQPGLELGSGSVYVITGAAGSIVSAITADLARGAGGGVFHLLDLAPAPDPADEELALFEGDRDALKRRIFERLRGAGERGTPAQVEAELARLERAHAAAAAIRSVEGHGGVAHYHSLDLRDDAAVAKVIEEIRESSGRIDVLLHAAGLERSRLLPDKSDDEFDLVFDVKCDGWLNLVRAIGDMPLGATVAFSSIAGRFGNGGQTDYSAANDLLSKCGSHLHAARPDTRCITIDWTAWASIGMASRGSIPELMARAGIDMLPPEAGIAVTRRELTAGGRSGEVLIAGRLGVLEEERDERGGLAAGALEENASGPMLGSVAGIGLKEGLRVLTSLEPKEQPFLDHHRIDGTAVLPGVMGLEGFAELAALWEPGSKVVAVEDVDFLAPFKFYRDEARDVELCAQLEAGKGGVSARCRLLGRRSLVGQPEPQVTEHFRARVGTAAKAPRRKSEAVPGEAPANTVGSEDIYRVYFHGPAYQVLDRAWRDGDAVIGRLAANLPANHSPGDALLATLPRLLELCFQTAGVWEIGSTGRMGLPQRIDRVSWLAPGLAEPALAFARVTPRTDGRCDAVVMDAEGRVLLRMEGYGTAALPADVPEALRAPLRDAVG